MLTILPRTGMKSFPCNMRRFFSVQKYKWYSYSLLFVSEWNTGLFGFISVLELLSSFGFSFSFFFLNGLIWSILFFVCVFMLMIVLCGHGGVGWGCWDELRVVFVQLFQTAL